VAGARFNPKSKDQVNKAHLLRLRQGASTPDVSKQLACWDATCEINDSLLAGIIQLLSLEHEVAVDCVLAAGYRLPQEMCLNLPLQQEDPTTESVKALYEGLAHSNASTSIQVQANLDFFPPIATWDSDKQIKCQTHDCRGNLCIFFEIRTCGVWSEQAGVQIGVD